MRTESLKLRARRRYNDAIFLAEYYTWQARRGLSLCGNDPITGRPRAKMYAPEYDLERSEAIYTHKAQARFWLNQARELRGYGQV